MITSIEHYYVHSSKIFYTFHRMFYNMPQIIFEYSFNFSRTFPGIFGDIPRNFSRHYPECLVTFPGMSRNVQRHSPECLRSIPEFFTTFPGIFHDIPQESLKTFPEYKILPNPRVPRIPFLVPIFLVLHIA